VGPSRRRSAGLRRTAPAQGVPGASSAEDTIAVRAHFMTMLPELRAMVYAILAGEDPRALLSLRATDRATNEDVRSRMPVIAIANAADLVDRALRLDEGVLPWLQPVREFIPADQAREMPPPVDPRAEADALRQELDLPVDRSAVAFENLTRQAVHGLGPADLQRLLAHMPAFARAGQDRDIAQQALDVAEFIGRMTGEQFQPHAEHLRAIEPAFLSALEDADRVLSPNDEGDSEDVRSIKRTLAGRVRIYSLAEANEDVRTASPVDRGAYLEDLAFAIRGLSTQQYANDLPRVAATVDLWLNVLTQQHAPEFSAALSCLTPDRMQPVMQALFQSENATASIIRRRGQVVANMHRLSDQQFEQMAEIVAPVPQVRPPFYHSESLLRMHEGLARMTPQKLFERREPLFRMMETLRNRAWNTGELSYVKAFVLSVAQMARASIPAP
jgi:hypothetical protein